MTAIAYDSTRPGLIPVDARFVLAYADGRYAWKPEDYNRFGPGVRLRKITVLGNPDVANICDVERGDVPADSLAKAATARTFIEGWNRHHMEPATIYCNRDTLAVVQGACSGLSYRVWLATLDGSRPRYYSGAAIVAVQYKDTGEYDESEVFDQGWLRRL